MKGSVIRHQSIMFVVMVIVGMLCNPMNVLAYKLGHLYLSLTLFYGGVLMATNMMWAHEIIHYLDMGHFNKVVFIIGIMGSIIISIVLRNQLFVDDSQWMKRMIGHHSTALTTTKLIQHRTNDNDIKKLSEQIIVSQENEIEHMKSLL